MKFKVRDGFVVKLITKIDLGNGTSEQQESTHFAGQIVDLDVETADLHTHKLEPMDKAATAYLDAKVMPVSQAAAMGITPELLALAKAMAAEIVAAAMQPVAPAAPAA